MFHSVRVGVLEFDNFGIHDFDNGQALIFVDIERGDARTAGFAKLLGRDAIIPRALKPNSTFGMDWRELSELTV